MKSLDELEVIDTVSACQIDVNGEKYLVLLEEVESFGIAEVKRRIAIAQRIQLGDAWNAEDEER